MGLRSYFIVSVSLLVPTLTYVFYEADKVGFRKEITASMVLCVFGFLGTVLAIPRMTHLFVKADIFGFDINKRGTPGGEIKIPESLGLISATMYLVCLCFLHLVHEQPVLYTAALSSVTLMTLLGFADDMLDLKWRYKLFLPLIACLPLLVNYTGSTSVMIPRPLRDYVGLNLVNIGYLYHLYMALMSIFCTNAINIYAGLNGLEAGQSFIICCFIMIHNAMQFSPFGDKDNLDSLRANNLLSLDILFPFLGCCLGILYHNWHPSKVFVGDTFCYFAGMTFAMASILGHFSETLLIMFIPQLINFVYSLPQLLGVIHCPRHRLPK
mmetsp:Transcript_2328/g.9861  ORF Transcript_2328/g.9861 Transcript_2328/m.9861 type:complete len:325 (-) Transcript_2328:323-1297(-)